MNSWMKCFETLFDWYLGDCGMLLEGMDIPGDAEREEARRSLRDGEWSLPIAGSHPTVQRVMSDYGVTEQEFGSWLEEVRSGTE